MSTRQQTAENRDIRAWARSNGVDLGDRGRIPRELRASYYVEHGAPSGGPDEGPTDPVERDDDADTTPGPGDPDRREPFLRSAPPPVPSVLEGVVQEPPQTSERAPVDASKRRPWSRKSPAGGPRKRESLQTLAAFAWGGMAQAAARAGRVPTSRMLALQAPIAGVLVDDVLRGTILDRVLQPLARTGKRGEAMFALMGPPILVEMIVQHPERQAVLLPLLASALESYADIAGPKLAAAKKKAERRAQEIGAEGIDELIAFLFAPPEGPGVSTDAAAA